LTLEPPLHDALTSDLRMGRPQWGAVVILDAEDGRVLALAEHSEIEKEKNGVLGAGVALAPLGKAASVFKIVTASALLRAGVSPDFTACTSGGKTRMRASNYLDDPTRDHRCVRFEDALPLSQNVAIAKMAGRFLTPETLAAEAERFLINTDKLQLELPVEGSLAVVPTDDVIGFAETAAGFGEVRLSALQGAVMANIVGSGGMYVAPRLIDHVEGEVAPVAPEAGRVLDEEHAQLLQAMMQATVTRGTATRAFSATRGPYGALKPLGVTVAGKTGSLTDRDVDTDTTWFVGTAPAHNPKIAVAVVIINDEWIWHVRALDVARRAVERYFALHPDHARTDAVALSR
jgi:peptidoglycan glycosyltransferase